VQRAGADQHDEEGVANGGAPLVRFTQDATAQHSAITGGVLLDAILNPITQTMVKLRVHPDQVAGTLLFTTKELPYPLLWRRQRVPDQDAERVLPARVAAALRKYEYGVYADEVLQHYAPFSLGVINNIANG
jgi:hypothetical protein